jgi:hypothetical protein
MQTHELIQDLSTQSFPAPDVRRWALAVWIGGTGLVLALSLALLPFRQDLHVRMADGAYRAQTVLSFFAFFVASAVAYRSSFPARLTRRDILWGWVPPLLLLALVLYRLTPSAFVAEFAGELTYRRGGCGVVIFSIGLLESGLLLFLARRGAPTRLGLTAAWIAVAAGGLGLFVTQFFVCYLENAFHLLLWHFAPVFLLIGILPRWGNRWLRW